MSGLIYDKHFSLERMIDTNGMDLDQKLKFGDGEYSIKEIYNMVDNSEKSIRLFLEWDNMCQYSVLGLVAKLNEITGEKRRLDFEKYMRREEYPNGIDYVKNVIYKDADPKLIDKIMAKYYDEILLMSPANKILSQLNFLSYNTETITFMFRYNHPALDSLISDIMINKLNNKVNCNKVILPNEEAEKNFIKSTTYNFYMVPDMGLYYQTLLDNEKGDTAIMSYRTHNGVSKPIMAFYINAFFAHGLPGPNNIELNFLDEYEFTKEDEEYWEDESRHPELRQMGTR